MELKSFLERALLNEQEQVRDYQRFAQTTDEEEVKRAFYEFAETSGHTATKIKSLLDRFYSGNQMSDRR
jgi:rubrerythrin